MCHKDLDEVLAIETQAYPHPWSRRVFEDCLAGAYLCSVLQQQDKIFGYAIISIAVGESHLLNICVDPKHQQIGVGRYMMQQLFQTARAENAESMLLEVRPSNKKAIRLYESLGFNKIGLRKAYYPATQGREDALVYLLEL